MKIFKIVALTLVIALLLGGCSLTRVDQEKVADLVVANVNGMDIHRYEINEGDISYAVQFQLYMAQQQGISYSQEQIEEMVKSQRESALEERVKAEVLLQKAAELGLALTEEEKAENLTEAQEYLDNMKNLFIDQVKQEFEQAAEAALEETIDNEDQAADDTADDASDETADNTDAAEDTVDDSEEVADDVQEPEQTEEPTDPEVLAEGEKRYQEYLQENEITLESTQEDYNKQDLIAKVREYSIGFAEVTDEDVRTWYDQTLVKQQEEIDAGAGAFEQLISGNKIYTYVPEGVVAVRDVVVAFDETLSKDLKAAYDGDQTSQYDTLLGVALTEHADYISTSSDIKARIEGGETIEEVVEAMSADMENISETSSPDGYVIDPRTQSYSGAFVEAAKGLENVGDLSEPFADYDGVHVLQLVKVYEPGIVLFDELKDSIKKALQPGAEEDKYNEMLEQWIEEANVKYYFDRLHSYRD